MTNIKFYLSAVIIFALAACGLPGGDRTILGKSFAERELKLALADKSRHNVVGLETTIIKDSLTAINIAESILFGIYGKRSITEQRPYETYFIDQYWIIRGTLPKDSESGTFSIIVDSRDCKVIRITHGK